MGKVKSYGRRSRSILWYRFKEVERNVRLRILSLRSLEWKQATDKEKKAGRVS